MGTQLLSIIMNHRQNMRTYRRFPVLVILLSLAFTWAYPPVSPDRFLMAAKKNTRKSRVHVKLKPVTGTREITIGEKTSVKIPVNYTIVQAGHSSYNGDDFVLNVFARDFTQGNAAYLEVLPHPGESLPRRLKLQAYFEGNDITLDTRAWGLRGIFAIPPDLNPGFATLEVKARGGRSDRVYRFPFRIGPTRFQTYRKGLNLGKYSDKDLFTRRPDLKARYESEKKRKDELFAKTGPDAMGNRLSHPRDHHRVTSAFYAKRIYDRYYNDHGKKIRTAPKTSFHLGLDLMGGIGSPIYALADGVVAIAEEMYYEGNHTVIDHGAGIYSRYMHQSEILVRTGQKVKAGELIGKVGDTGMVTGPHLHVGLIIRGIYVDPTSLLCLPVKSE